MVILPWLRVVGKNISQTEHKIKLDGKQEGTAATLLQI